MTARQPPDDDPDAGKAPRRPRQAVVIIHGIGEQRPMETLRAFVRGAVKRAALSKPDRITPTLELRRMAVPGESTHWRPGLPVSTDFYEFYWAHLMEGTSWDHVTAWAQTLMVQRPAHVPPRLRTAWRLSWVIAAITVGAIGTAWQQEFEQWPIAAALVAGLVVLAKSTGQFFGLQYVGDAARYLNSTPPNVGVRHAIRSDAIDLLNALNDDDRYHRVVVVGHSLGSVIAYDALTHVWQQRHHPPDEQLTPTDQRAQEELKADLEHPSLDRDAGRALQGRIWREQRRIGVPWKITDLVTLGSPLTHASFLMAKSRGDFRRRKRQRELPTCPPRAEDRRDHEYGRSLLLAPEGTSVPCRLLHHAALFAATRWTNLYFPGDLVGGALSECFGRWILDRPLEPSGRAGRGLRAHVRYWNPHEKSALAALREALDLDGWWTDALNTDAALGGGSANDRAQRSELGIDA